MAVIYRFQKILKRSLPCLSSNQGLCYECGFSNASYFAETFKKVYGVSPKKYILNVKQMRQIFAPNPSVKKSKHIFREADYIKEYK